MTVQIEHLRASGPEAETMLNALERLITRAQEAQRYINDGNNLAAIGSTMDLPEFMTDVTAASTLLRRVVQ